MIKETEIAYLAGLFDGEGYVSYKKYPKKRPNNKKPYQTWNIQMEVSMTDKSIIKYMHETLGVGSVNKRPPQKTSMGKKMQWRWRCGYRDAYKVCVLFWPYSHIKLEKIQKIIEHYSQGEEAENVVDLNFYKKSRLQ